MDLNIKHLGKSKANDGQRAKKSDAPEQAPVVAGVAASAPTDALALGDAPDGEGTSSRQVARECAEKLTRLHGAASDPTAFEQLTQSLGTPSYVVIDAVNRLCRDTQGEPFEDRVKALNMIQHLVALPDGMRGAIEEDLRRTSAAS